MYKKYFDIILDNLLKEVKDFYGERLITLAIFGSVGRGTFRPDSDIDLLIIASDLPRGRIARVEEFLEVERKIEPLLNKLKNEGIDTYLSPVIKQKDEVLKGSLLFLDMIDDAKILYDKEDFFKNYLSSLKEKLQRLGTEKIYRGGGWYWVLKKDYRYGEVILKAQKRLKILNVLLEEEAYSDVIREAQEIVELAVKGMLRQIGIDPPKQHDVSPLLSEHQEKLPADVISNIPEIMRISKWLRKEREFAFYGDIDFIPTEEYTLQDAQKAINDAIFVVKMAERVIK
ncbi:HEPN domain-containing protein [Carboxydothermus hydrogenoformans]|uniref:Nucleotidyltransferase/HEPN domain protein n=1 Tax=Carboxydothermus hydrogenoformans (strain ATCC BAA-161 / DSM 6008 / Z-2901) TaxID=246194 RepID=Q3ABE8_CARHZ|nr:HEPN domain-containing protein [Carboxydothermus hydrogenoformans]ABB13638.1 nucleotidyltransferase/HEPN domain protein [Carboxydothermus hydrogenoformans Z-2901]